MLTGIDVSNWQGAVDWAAWKRRGIAFAFAKATEGTGFRDGQFPRNWREMKRLGVRRGAYHFARPRNSAGAEAAHFLGYVRSQGLDSNDMLVLDLEEDDGRYPSAVAAYARAWCAHVEAETGIRPLVYTYLSFAGAGNCAGLGAYPLWIADPSRPAGSPRVPAPWQDWVIHQHATQPVDLNVARSLPGSGGPGGPGDLTTEGPDVITDADVKKIAEATARAIGGTGFNARGWTYADTAQKLRESSERVEAALGRVEAVLAELKARPPADVDEPELAAALAAVIAQALPTDLAQQVADELAQRLAS